MPAMARFCRLLSDVEFTEKSSALCGPQRPATSSRRRSLSDLYLFATCVLKPQEGCRAQCSTHSPSKPQSKALRPDLTSGSNSLQEFVGPQREMILTGGVLLGGGLIV